MEQGSANYRIGLVIMEAQPFHKGHLKIMTDALMDCNEIIVSFTNYDTNYFDFKFNQKVAKDTFLANPRIAYFGIKNDPNINTPKQIIEKTIEELEKANYYMPTHFFTHYEDWIEPAKECHLNTKHISPLILHKSNEIKSSVFEKTDFWKEKVPYNVLEEIETYIATKERNF